ncbi:MAG: F0F1 ATP synthase subunit epsilon [Clostridia bacterium]|nr:F0F1 ATP synthase subunit epsilon [Clostridia bacterium]
MNTFQLNISSPDGRIFTGEVSRITVRGAMGDLAVLAGHIPLITSVKAGNCVLQLEDGSVRRGHTGGGMLTVGKGEVTFLTSSLEWYN